MRFTILNVSRSDFYSGIASVVVAGIAGYYSFPKKRKLGAIVGIFIAIIIVEYYRSQKEKNMEVDVFGNSGNGGNSGYMPNDEYSPIEENDGNTWNDGTKNGTGSVSENTDVYNPNDGRLTGTTRIIRPYNGGVIR